MSLRLLPCGEHAVLVELEGLPQVLAAEALVRAECDQGDGVWGRVLDVVPAATTLLVTTAGSADTATIRRELPVLLGSLEHNQVTRDAELITIEVSYDGPDLDEIASLTGLSVAEVIAAHTGTRWQVAFGGFAPGFAYLSGGDRRLEVPRRTQPRTKVPVGAVGLAGSFSGIYPKASPGGWQLLGTTTAPLWELHRDPPALLRPGCQVQFVDLGAQQ